MIRELVLFVAVMAAVVLTGIAVGLALTVVL